MISGAHFLHYSKDPEADRAFLCDDLASTMRSLQAKQVSFAPIAEAQWGTVTTFTLPSGSKIGLYQPKHPTALGLR